MNITSCLLASGFIISSFFYTIYKDISTNKINKLRNLLNEKQNKIFDNIKKERLEIYQASIIVGLLIAYYYTSKNNSTGIIRYCTFASILSIVSYAFYTLSPKSDYMLNHITTEEQVKAWLDIYIEMKKNFHYGFLFGIIGYSIAANVFKL
tara:strand:- start:506 stop:958 length:453 start_codon:yes stop_codon:yes gene_type:complete